MPYCRKCGSKIEQDDIFCEFCGAKQREKQTQPVESEQESKEKIEIAPIIHTDYLEQAIPQQSGKNKTNWVAIISIAALLVGLITLGVLYGIQTVNLNKANDNIAELESDVSSLESEITIKESNIVSLQTQLAAEEANVANLQTQLATEEAHVADLQDQLDVAKSNLDSANSQIDQLQSDLGEAQQNLTDIQNQLDTAQANINQLQADISQMQIELNQAYEDLDDAISELSTIRSPRHFTSLSELQTWLANDDTDTRYSSETALNRAYILQVKALRDGYILPVSIHYPGDHTFYSYNTAFVNGNIYIVSSYNDSYYFYVNPDIDPPPYPLPLE